MDVRRSLILLVPCTLALLGLFLGLQLVEHTQIAQAALPGAEIQAPAAEPEQDNPADPRWLELVRSLEGGLTPGLDTLEPGSPAAALSANLNLTDFSLAGSAPSLLPVYVSITRDGHEIASGSAMPVPEPGRYFYSISLDWQIYIPCPPDWCYDQRLEPGDELRVTQGSTTINLTVPLLTVLAESRSDNLYGSAPSNSALSAFIFPIADPQTVYTQTGSAAPDGTYQISLAPAHDLHRQDSGYLMYEADPARRAYRRFIAPMLRVQVGGAAISGVAPPNASVYITHTISATGAHTVLAADSNSRGEFNLDYYWGYQSPPPLSPGDRLTAVFLGQVFSMTIPVLSITADLAGQQVSGQAAPGSSLEVRRFMGPLDQVSEDYIWVETPLQSMPATASPSGGYMAPLALQPGDYLGVFQTQADENQAYARTATSSIFARMDEPKEYSYASLIKGQLSLPASPITFTITGPSGYYKDWRVLYTNSAGEFEYYSDYYSQQLALDSGDVIRVFTPVGEEVAFTLPLLTAEADRASATVFGMAPPGARLTVVVIGASPLSTNASYSPDGLDGIHYTPEIPITQVVTASLDGTYLADFSQGWTFHEGYQYTYGEVIFKDPQTNRASRAWVLGGCPPRLLGAQVAGNRVIVNDGWLCSDATVHLSDSNGNLKAEAYLHTGYPDERGGWRVDLYDDETGSPVEILPGDRIEITYEGKSAQSTVPSLDVQIDPATNLASGNAPPGEQVSIELWRTNEFFPGMWLEPLAVVTATQSGTFQANLSSTYTYQTGDRIIATLSGRSEAYYALTVVPALDVRLYSDWASGWLPPLTPFTLRYTGTSTSTERSHFADTDGWLNEYLHDAHHIPLMMVPGDQLELEAAGVTYRLTIPHLTTVLDRQSARLSGEAPPGARLRVKISDSDDYSYQEITQVITATAQGTYNLDFPQLLPLGTTGGSLTYLHPQGHEVWLEFSTPHLEMTLEYPCLDVYMPVLGAPAGITLTSAGGAYSETVELESFPYLWNPREACFSRAIQSGDLLEFDDEHGNHLSMQVPLLEARHDYALQALIGKAPPGSKVKAVFLIEWMEISRTPWLDADGSFGVDTSDLKLGIGVPGYVVMPDADGNQIKRFFDITGYRVHLPVIGRAE